MIDKARLAKWLPPRLRGALLGDGGGGVFARGVTGVMGVRMGGALLAFGAHAALARMLGVTEFGVFVYAWTLLNFGLVFSKVGFDKVLIRYIARYRAQSNWGGIRGLRLQSRRTATVVSVLLGLGGAGALALLGGDLDPSMRRTLGIACAALPIVTLAALEENTLLGLKKVVLATAPYLIGRPLLTVTIVGVAYLLGTATASVTMGATLVAVAVVLWVQVRKVARYMPEEVADAPPTYPPEGWLRTTLPFLAISMSALVESKIDILMLGVMSSAADVGVYGAVARVSALISLGVSATNTVVAPYISDFHTRGDMDRLRDMTTAAALLIFVLTAATGLMLAFFGEAVLSLFGSDFVGGVSPLLILVGGAVVGALTGPVSYLLSMTGRQGFVSKIVVASAVTNFVLNLVLIPRYGLVGAATATSITIVLRNVTLAIGVGVWLGVNPTVFGRHTLTFLSRHLKR